MKGKRTAGKGKMDTQEKEMEEIPPEVMNKYRDVHLDLDVMFVNETTFLTAVSRHFFMKNARAVLNCKHIRMKDAITTIKSAYEKKGFNVKMMHGDNKFTSLQDWLSEEEVTLEYVLQIKNE